jgi:dTDP-4-dehydrorhamnose reductase
VFSGNRGNYTEKDLHDCVDDYGKSKSLGENLNNTNIRTSIIGEELFNKKSLIEWVKSNKNSTINGFSNHFWNGVTCLELAKFIEILINENNFWKGTKHIFSPESVSKYQLVNLINDVYNLDIKINKIEHNYCNRLLNSQYDLVKITSLGDQLQQQKEFNIF